MSNVSLLIITADRPPEHQGWGVGQSLDQRGLFGRHVREEITMPVGADGGPDHSERAGWRAVATAVHSSGPVHLNWPFRLPLEPTSQPGRLASALPRCPPRQMRRLDEDLERFAVTLRQSSTPVLVAGPDTNPLRDPAAARAILQSASDLNIPVLADVLSGLRGYGPTAKQPALINTAAELNADLAIHVGQTPTAKSIRLWWEGITHSRHMLIDPLDDWQDPSHRFDERLISDPAWLLSSASSAGPARNGASDRADHAARWAERGQMVDGVVTEALHGCAALTEAHIGAAVGRWAAGHEDRTVVASSSMPIRDLDTFAPTERAITAFSNRGANGIDGWSQPPLAYGVHEVIGSWRSLETSPHSTTWGAFSTRNDRDVRSPS